MLKGIDHLVVVVPDLEIAVREYSDRGFTVVPGGRHPGGSRNALIGLADGAYVELLVFDEPNPRHRWWAIFQRTLRDGECLADFCVSTDDLDSDVRALRQAGVRMDDPHPGSRARPDGYTVEWLLSVPPAWQSAVAPFLIQDVTPRGERVPKEHGHRNQVIGIDTLTIVTSEPERARQWFAGVLPSAARQDISRPDLDATGVRVTIGGHVIDYVRPGGSSSPLHAWLLARGPSPYAVTLRTSGDTVGPLLLGGQVSVRMDAAIGFVGAGNFTEAMIRGLEGWPGEVPNPNERNATFFNRRCPLCSSMFTATSTHVRTLSA